MLVSLLAVPLVQLTSRADAATKLPAKEHFKIILLIGQSNMAGRGKVDPKDNEVDLRVMALNKADEWAPAVDPLHFDKPNVVGVGPGLACGKAIAASLPGDVIGLVPSAVGGTSITEWKPGGKLYKEAVRRAKLALEHGTLAGIMWHQGEADSSAEKIAAYPAKAAELFASLRRDLSSPNAPIVVGMMGEFIGDRATQFNTMLKKLPDTIPHCGVAESTGLKDKGDHLHFDAASARELGRRYAKAWSALVPVK